MREELIKLGFRGLPHFTVAEYLVMSLDRGRSISIGDLGTPNEVMFLRSANGDGKSIEDDLICIHNYDYDGKLTLERVKLLIAVVMNLNPTDYE